MIRDSEATDSSSAGDEPPVLRSPALAPDPIGEAQSFDFRDIYAENFGFVWRCLRALGVPARQLDDAAQEVFIAVHRGLGSFRRESSIRTWLYGIVRNVAYKQRRTLHRKDRAEPLVEEPPASSPTPHEQAQDAEAAAFIRQFIEGLDDKKRDVFVLVLLEGLSISELAPIIDVPLNTAYTRLRAVRADFRGALQRHRART